MAHAQVPFVIIFSLKLDLLSHGSTMSLIYRSTVHSNMVPPNEYPSLPSYEHRQRTGHTSNNGTVTDVNSANPSKVLRPPPRVPAGTRILILSNHALPYLGT